MLVFLTDQLGFIHSIRDFIYFSGDKLCRADFEGHLPESDYSVLSVYEQSKTFISCIITIMIVRLLL